MDRSYQLSDVLTESEWRDIVQIVRTEEAARSTPHRAIVEYLNARPHIIANCNRVGLLPDFFAYQVEWLVTSRAQWPKNEKN